VEGKFPKLVGERERWSTGSRWWRCRPGRWD